MSAGPRRIAASAPIATPSRRGAHSALRLALLSGGGHAHTASRRRDVDRLLLGHDAESGALQACRGALGGWARFPAWSKINLLRHAVAPCAGALWQ